MAASLQDNLERRRIDLAEVIVALQIKSGDLLMLEAAVQALVKAACLVAVASYADGKGRADPEALGPN